MKSQNSPVLKSTDAKFWESVAIEKILDLKIINGLKEIGGVELIKSLFETFFDDSSRLLTELIQTEVNHDLKQFDQILHKLKGSSGSIGANKIYVLAKYLNEGSRKGTWPENDSWMEMVNSAYAETVKELQNLV
ncbi:MAG: Hpt domain-containing protein [Chlorobiaceae bacterium]